MTDGRPRHNLVRQYALRCEPGALRTYGCDKLRKWFPQQWTKYLDHSAKNANEFWEIYVRNDDKSDAEQNIDQYGWHKHVDSFRCDGEDVTADGHMLA